MAAYRAIHAANGGAESTTLTVRTPGGTVVGDCLIAGVMIDGAKVEPTMSGWTKLGQVNTTTGEAQTFAIFWKIATEAGEKLETVTWGGAKRYNAGVILAVKEPHATEPIADFQMQSNTTSSTAMKFAQATVGAAESVSVLFGGIDQTGTGTPPTNWTERSDNTIGTYVATRDNPPVEATGEKTVTLSTARITNTAHIIVRPVASGKTVEAEGSGSAEATGEGEALREIPVEGSASAEATGEGEGLREIPAEGAGASEATGSGEALREIFAEGEGEASATGEGEAEVEVKGPTVIEAEGEGTAEATGSGEAFRIIYSEGSGTAEATGQGEAEIETPAVIEAEGEGTAEATGSGEAFRILYLEGSGSAEATGEGKAEIEGKAEPISRRPSRKPPLELDVEIETAEGAVFRLSANDPKAVNRPTGITFTTQRGTGFGTGAFTLNRQIFKDYPDLNLMDTVRFVGRQSDIAYEGRVLSLPRQNDPQQMITINLVGWMTYLKGRPMSALIIDRRLSGWGEPSGQRKANLLIGGDVYAVSTSSGWQDKGTLGPAVVFSYSQFSSGFIELGESWIYAGGEDIGVLKFDLEQMTELATNSDYLTVGGVSTDDVASEENLTADLNNENKFGNEVAPLDGMSAKYAFLLTLYAGEFTGTTNMSLAFLHPRIVGTHALTQRGFSPEEGYYVSDIIEYLLRTYRPKITWAGEQNTFPVQQATWHDSPSNPYDAIQQLNNFILWETNVWEERKFYFEPADLTKTDWQIKTSDPGVSVNFQGDSIESTANGIVITYWDFYGHSYRLEPTDHEELRDENENNPANRHGEENWIEKQVPWPCLEAEALQFGRAQLGEYNRPKRPGSFTINGGYIKDGAGHWRQGWQVRNSETLSVMDHPTEAEPRLNYATTWDQDSLSLTVTVDAPPQTIDAIVARNALALEAKNLG